MTESGGDHTVAGENIVVKKPLFPTEQVENIRPSYREVAVPIPHFRETQRDGKKVSEYTGDKICSISLF